VNFSVSLVTSPRDIRPRIQNWIPDKGSRAYSPGLRNTRIYIPSVHCVKREDMGLKLNSISCPCQECVDICLHQISHHYLFQMKPTRCTLLLSTFISNFLHVSGNYVPIIRRIYCIYATLVRVAVWSAGADQTATHTEWKIPMSHRYSKFSWWWAHSCPKHVENLK